jgi:hypothetical protein
MCIILIQIKRSASILYSSLKERERSLISLSLEQTSKGATLLLHREKVSYFFGIYPRLFFHTRRLTVMYTKEPEKAVWPFGIFVT